MENRNNALHYKMYKSGKSIVYAGLATTAALAGLVLANTNATAVHADTAAPASAAITSNVASSAVASAASAYSAANSDYYAARHAQAVAHKAANAASDSAAVVSGVNTADLTAWWNQSGQSDYNRAMNAKSNAQANLDEAQAQSDSVVNAWNQASDAVVAAEKAGLKSDSNEMKALNAQKSLAWNNMQTVQNAIASARKQVKAADSILNSEKDGISLNEAKAIMDQLPALKKAAQEAEQAYKDAVQATKDAGDIANAKFDAWTAARKANNLPYGTDDPVYQSLSDAASSAAAQFPVMKLE